MMIDFTQPVLYDAANSGYMVTLADVPSSTNGGPNYEVLESDPLWADVQAWLAEGNTAALYLPPAAVPPTAQQQAAATIATIQAKLINGIVVGPNAVGNGLTAADIANWKAAQAVLSGT
jgi:hypothetical protein